MKKINWQAYLDGSLSQEDQAIAEQLLLSDPKAKSELQGLIDFKNSLKSACLEEVVPYSNLNRFLNETVKANKVPWYAKPMFMVPTAIAAVALASAVVLFSPQQSPLEIPSTVTAQDNTRSNRVIDLRKSPFQARKSTPDSKLAAHFAAEKLHRSVPVVSLASIPGATLEEVECGYCWLAYKFKYKNEEYTLYGRHESQSFEGINPIPADQCDSKQSFYKTKDGIGWECAGGMTYVLKGGNSDGQLILAQAAAKETPNLIASL